MRHGKRDKRKGAYVDLQTTAQCRYCVGRYGAWETFPDVVITYGDNHDTFVRCFSVMNFDQP